MAVLKIGSRLSLALAAGLGALPARAAPPGDGPAAGEPEPQRPTATDGPVGREPDVPTGTSAAGEGPTPAPTAASPSIQDPAVWDALVGSKVTIALADQEKLAGRLLGRRGAQLVVARAPDGEIVTVELAEVVGVFLYREDPGVATPRHGTGGGMIGAGATLLGIGGSAFVAGAVFMFILPALNPFMNIHLLGGGAALVGGGAALVAGGRVRRRAWAEYEASGLASLGRSSGLLPMPALSWGYTLRF
jgi:hypothetical protein